MADVDYRPIPLLDKLERTRRARFTLSPRPTRRLALFDGRADCRQMNVWALARVL